MTQRTREEFGRDCKKIARNVDLNQFSYQLKKIRRPERKLPTPDFALNDKLQSDLIRRLFPKFETDSDQRAQSGLYNRILYSYFRERQTAHWIQCELNAPRPRTERTKYIKLRRVERIIQDCRNAAAGLRRNGKSRTYGRRGPKIHVSKVFPKESSTIFDESNQHLEELSPSNRENSVLTAVSAGSI